MYKRKVAGKRKDSAGKQYSRNPGKRENSSHERYEGPLDMKGEIERFIKGETKGPGKHIRSEKLSRPQGNRAVTTIKRAVEIVQKQKQVTASIVIPQRLFTHALEVFESRESVIEWLSSKPIALGSISPAELLKTEDGKAEFERELIRIEAGVL